MPKPSSSLKKQEQARNARLREKVAEQKAWHKYQDKQRKEQEKQRDAILKATLKLVKGKGIYDPKDTKLTKYRRTKLRKVQKEYGQFLDPSKYFFVKPDKKVRKTFVEKSSNLNMVTTKLGTFIAREGHTRAAVKYDKKIDELYIERSGKRKFGTNSGTIYRTITPMASADELDKERDRLRALASKFGKLTKDERLTFVVHENGVSGYSKNTYSNIEILLASLDKYQKSIAAKVQFFRHITVEKRGREEYHKWNRVYREQQEQKRREYENEGKRAYKSRIRKLKTANTKGPNARK